MPRPRFNKLPVEKREQIMEAAAKEFATFGYDEASMNRILEQAEVSKGAAYYYFDDKADLLVTAAEFYVRRMLGEINIFPELPASQPLDLSWQSFEGIIRVQLERLTAETFWSSIKAVFRQTIPTYLEDPWKLTVWKASTRLSQEARSNPLLADLWNRAMGFFKMFLERGQTLGVIRTDLPDDLLLALVR